MRLRMLAWGAVLGLLVALLTPMAALAQAETTTTHFSDTGSFPEVNPCSGATGTATVDFKGVRHITALDNGTFHETGTDTGTFTFVPDDPSQPTYTGHFASWFGQNVNSRNFTETSTFNVALKGSDGSRLTVHLVAHVTLHADGTATVEFEKQQLHCA
jgi:hypothetical protein